MLRSLLALIRNLPRYATGGFAVRLPCSGYDETAQAIALGGASLAHEFRGDRTGPRPDHIEFRVHHGRENDR